MTTDYRTTLPSIRRFDQLIAFLRDDMDWPIVSEDFEELTFEYSAEELGIDAANAAKIQEIKRLRPLAANQPWGVFFVKFEPKRLPVVALRSILGRVALKKRASANNAERPAWAMGDLLFISNYGEGDARQISFAHFAAPTGTKLPTLKVVAWDDKDTAPHLDQVARDLTEGLAWPDNEDDADAWRERWRAAFTLGYREAITTAQQLSVRLAELAKVTRDRIHGALEIESERGRITRLMKAFSETLVHDLDADGFADMVAQTIAYGLLSARITDPQRASADDLAHHMRTNPLLRDLMSAFLELSGRQPSMGIDFDELGVSEVVELLDHANMDAVVRDFGDKNLREDPVIHFYESFLSEYDKQKKVERGVFYTPRPVVSYIVRSVDQLLRTEFGLDDGLADVTTWGEMTKRHKELTIPEGVSPEQDFVHILDPATGTGTGTFLVEVIDLIHRTLVNKWKAQGPSARQTEALWNEYVPKHLLPRLHGYELLMAPYAIAHLKIGLKLYETGYRFDSDERAQVYLTNALEPTQDFSGLMDFAVPALADEAKAVNRVKGEQRFTVVVGNPPYSGHSANKGEWIRGLLRGQDGDSDFESYFQVDGGPLEERNPKWLNDDYVKFLRLAQFQIERTGHDIIGYITNHSYLDNPTFRGMRQSLMDSFGEVHLLDLHGNSKKKERTPEGGKDENVFDIQQGVAVALYVQQTDIADDSTRVLHADLWGERDAGPESGKYGWLATNDLASTQWAELAPTSPRYLFVPRDETLTEEYEAGWGVTDIFPVNSVGVVTARDKLAIQWTADEMRSLAADFPSCSPAYVRRVYGLRAASDESINNAQRDILDHQSGEHLAPILYRPFDFRFTWYSGKAGGFIERPRREVMRHMLAGPNVGLTTARGTEIFGGWEHVFLSKSLIQHHTVSLKEVNYLFPLYTYPTEGQEHLGMAREPNLGDEFVEALATSTELEFTSDASGNLQESFGPDDVLNYIYAVLHSPKYRQRYADFLKSDFPRIPLASDPTVFAALVTLGKSLTALHLMELEGDESPAFPKVGDNRIDRVRYAPPPNGVSGRVFINRDQYFEGVTPETWGFTIGGYRPAEKWLKDRKGRTLSDDDNNHYRQLVAALVGTKRLMGEIDELIEQHGGWPEAFQ